MRGQTVQPARQRREPLPGVAALLTVPLLLLLVMLTAMLTGPQVLRLPTVRGTIGSPPAADEDDLLTPRLPTMTPQAPGEYAESSALAVVVTVVAVLILAAGLIAAGWLLYRHRLRIRFSARGVGVDESPAERETTASAPAVAAVVEAGIDELDDEDADPRRAVIACWLRLESAATAAGVERRPDDAPADLVTRLLRSYDVDESLLHNLAGLYRHARYAPGAVDAGMRTQAREILGRLRAELTAAPRERAEP